MNILKVKVCLLLVVSFGHYVFMWDKEFLLKYILHLHRILQLQETNWFISEHLEAKDHENLQDLFNTIHRKMMITQMVITNNSEIKMSKTTSKMRYMGLVMTSGANDPIMRLHARALQGRRFSLNFVVLVKALEHPAEAEPLMRLLHQKNFVNLLLFVQYTNQSSDILGMISYPNFAIRSRKNMLLDMKKEIMKFAVGSLDCKGHEFYTPLRLDLPGVFYFINKKNVSEEHGWSLTVLLEFMNNINARLLPYEMPANKSNNSVVNMKDILQLMRARKFLISAHAYALFSPDEEIDKSSSTSLVKWCLMVPIRHELSNFNYAVVSYQRPVWYAICISYIALVTIDYLWLCWESQRSSRQKSDLILQIAASFTNNLCCLLFISPWKQINCPSVIRFLLYSAVFYHAFFISIGYSALLGSILTVSLFKHQINTMEDLIKANLSTMIIDYELEFLLGLHMDLPKAFLKLLVVVDSTTFHVHQTSFNQSYAYFVCEHQWRFLRQQQQHLKPGLFKFTDICFGTFNLGFPMESDSPLSYYIQYFILRLDSFGFLKYFEETAFPQAIRAGLVQRFKPDNDYQAAKLSHISSIFFIWIGSCCVCIIVFLCEYFYFRLKVKCKSFYRK